MNGSSQVGVDAGRLVNLRDLGGLAVVGGGVTRPGILYRSDAPYPDDERPSHVPIWPPGAVLDLRSQQERVAVGHEWSGATTLHHAPLHQAAAPGAEPPADLAEVYSRILDHVPDRVAAAVTLAAGAGRPLLVNCAAGKDRTGIVVAALLLAADVEPEEVVADYLISAANMPALRRRWDNSAVASQRDRPKVQDAWLLAPEDAIRQVIGRLTGWPGGMQAWLVDHGADPKDLARWREALVDRVGGQA